MKTVLRPAGLLVAALLTGGWAVLLTMKYGWSYWLLVFLAPLYFVCEALADALTKEGA